MFVSCIFCVILYLCELILQVYIIIIKKVLKYAFAYEHEVRSKHVKGSEECYLLGQNTTCNFLG